MSRPARADAPHWQERREALRELLARPHAAPVPGLLAALADRASGVRTFAVNALRDLGPEAVKPLAAALKAGRHPVECAAILANSLPGRQVLRARAGQSEDLLTAALREQSLPVRIRIGVTKALVVCPGEGAVQALVAALADPSVMLQYAAGRALWSRREPTGARWVIEYAARQELPSTEMIAWLGEVGSLEGLPLLQRLASVWRTPFLPRPQRLAARQAIAAVEEQLARIPAGALSRAEAPRGLTDAALSLWQEEDEEAGEPDR